MKKNIITNKITPCCGLPFSVVYWWVSNLALNSEADRQFILSKISQNGTISIDGWKVLINSGVLEVDASLTKSEFLNWFDCEKKPSCEQLKMIIESFKVSNWSAFYESIEELNSIIDDFFLKYNSDFFEKSNSIELLDKNTNEIIIFKRTDKWFDGTQLNDGKIDGTIFIKKDDFFYKRVYEKELNVKWFGAKGNGVSDDTQAFKKAFEFLAFEKSKNLIIPNGVFLISETLNLENEINLIGQIAFKQIMAGGAEKENGSIIRWIGNDGNVMLKISNLSGIEIKNICFDSGNGTVLNFQNITGIQFINESVTRHNIIKNCYFNLLNKGIEFFDSGENPNSNNNMDSNSIQNCIFYYCEIGICIDQLNVYNCDIYYCSFYGNYNYTKHHLLIKKGHADVIGGYFGVLKDENSAGGRNGVAIDVSNGFINVSNVYGECHNGEFFIWRSSNVGEPSISSISNCIINADSSKFPNDYQVLNETNNILNIYGGHFSGKFCQINTSNGYILADNCYSPQISSNSKAGAVILKGIVNGYKSNGDEVRSVAPIPKVAMLNLNTGKDLQFIWSDDDILTLTVPGYYGGIQFNFQNKTIYMGGWTLVQ